MAGHRELCPLGGVCDLPSALAQARAPLPHHSLSPPGSLHAAARGRCLCSSVTAGGPQDQVHVLSQMVEASEVLQPHAQAPVPLLWQASRSLAEPPHPCCSLPFFPFVLQDWACCHCLSGHPPVWSGAAAAPPLSLQAGLGCFVSGLQGHMARQGFWLEKEGWMDWKHSKDLNFRAAHSSVVWLKPRFTSYPTIKASIFYPVLLL